MCCVCAEGKVRSDANPIREQNPEPVKRETARKVVDSREIFLGGRALGSPCEMRD
jgi:hypothetical protein